MMVPIFSLKINGLDFSPEYLSDGKYQKRISGKTICLLSIPSNSEDHGSDR
jgi:hypothetical protein